MYNFKEHLQEDEKILYEGRPVPGAGSKSIGGLIFVICFALGIQALMIWSVVTKTGDGAEGVNLGFIIMFLVATLFLGIGVYGLVYNLFLKKRQVADDFYCLTNIRAMKYEAKKDKLVFGYLEYYDDIYCSNVKNKYGDLYMGIVMDDSNSTSAHTLVNLMTNPNPENMPFISFESIENPHKVMKLAKSARADMLQKSNQQ